MELFVTQKRALTITEISDAFGWPRSSTFNIVTTLAKKGYLYEPVGNGMYFPTGKMRLLGEQLSAAEPLPPTVHYELQELVTATGATAVVAGVAAGSGIFLDVVEAESDIRYFARVGKSVRLETTAVGHAILSQYPEKERESILKRFKYEASNLMKQTNAEQMEKSIRASAKRGWFEWKGTPAFGLTGVAVPLPLRGRRLALGLGGPTFHMQNKTEKFAAALQAAAARIVKSDKTSG